MEKETPDNGHCPPRQWIFIDNGRFVSLFLSIEEASIKLLERFLNDPTRV